MARECVQFPRGSHPRKSGPPRQQLLALHAKRPCHRLTALHQLFWVVVRRLWAGWKEPLILVTPRTVVGWHRAGFRLYWKWLSRTGQRGGRKRVSKEIRALIFRMVAENPTWGAPSVHGELLKLGFDLSETTVSRWLRRVPRTPDPAKEWSGFRLLGHSEVIYALPQTPHWNTGSSVSVRANTWLTD